MEISRKIAAKRAEGKRVVTFGIGDPDVPTPSNIVDRLIEAARDPINHRYPETDGLPELQNVDGEILGYERVLEIFHRCPQDDPESIVACLENKAYDWLGGRAADDDFTFVVVRVV